MKKRFYSLSEYYRNLFGEKVYKIALDPGTTCPNRDGTLGSRGCIFCSEGGSGDFTSQASSIWEQIEEGKKLLSTKNSGAKFIAYFQAYTGTYGDIEQLRSKYEEALKHPDILGISIATRPDCLGPEVLSVLAELSRHKKVWVELGLQTIHEQTASFIRRAYPLSSFDDAVDHLNQIGIDVVVHLILGLPGETKEDILESVAYVVNKNIQGIKLQLLHILKETDLATYYLDNPFPLPTLEEYADWISDCIEMIPPHVVIHRITGDGPKKLLIAPLWSANKKNVLNTLHAHLEARECYQGKTYRQNPIDI